MVDEYHQFMTNRRVATDVAEVPSTRQLSHRVGRRTALSTHGEMASGAVTAWRLQKVLGNAALSRSLAEHRVLQRMITPYTLKDLGQIEDVASWRAETIVAMRTQRSGISDAVKKTVIGRPNGGLGGDFRHFVPYDRIDKQLYGLLVGKTREECIKLLEKWLDALGIKDESGMGPLGNRMAFDAWFSWTYEAICDWPMNIYQGPHYGDHAGQTLDVAKDAPPQLRERLMFARDTLHHLLGVSWDFKFKSI
jgi:hypothetical protein